LIIPPLPQNNKNRAFARFFAQIAIYRANAHLPVGRLALKPPYTHRYSSPIKSNLPAFGNSQKIYAISADYRLPRAEKYVMMGKMIYIEQKEGKTYGTESQRFSK
jgi:hypothetical protein